MKMRTVTLATLALAMPLFAQAASVKNVHKTVPLSPSGVVSLETHNGTVTVTGWNQPNVDIDARIEAGDSDYPEDVDKTNVRITGSGSDVRIVSDYTAVGEHALGWFGFGSERVLPPIHYTIHMPATARLSIEDHNARVRVASLRNDVTVRSHNGPVEITDLDGAADVETHNGDVRLGFARFAKMSSVETHNGSCSVRLPAASRFTLDVDAHKHDPVESDFAMVRGGREESSYSAAVNGGGPKLRFSTHNGSLRLGKN